MAPSNVGLVGTKGCWYKGLQPWPVPQGWVCFFSHFCLPCARPLHLALPLPCHTIHTNRYPLYLHPDVHHHGIQEVEDTGGDAISSVLGKPAIAAQYVFGPLGGHGQAQLLHQPAALGGGPVMAQLGGDTPGLCLGRVHHRGPTGYHELRDVIGRWGLCVNGKAPASPLMKKDGELPGHL